MEQTNTKEAAIDDSLAEPPFIAKLTPCLSCDLKNNN